MLATIRGAVRPAVVVVMTLCTAAFVTLNITIPGEWWSMYGMVVAYWFASRTKTNS